MKSAKEIITLWSDSSLVEPNLDTIDSIERILKMNTLSKKMEQIGFEVQLISSMASVENLEQTKSNIYAYMSLLRYLCIDCVKIEKNQKT